VEPQHVMLYVAMRNSVDATAESWQKSPLLSRHSCAVFSITFGTAHERHCLCTVLRDFLALQMPWNRCAWEGGRSQTRLHFQLTLKLMSDTGRPVSLIRNSFSPIRKLWPAGVVTEMRSP
jgi:hypothetical protein